MQPSARTITATTVSRSAQGGGRSCRPPTSWGLLARVLVLASAGCGSGEGAPDVDSITAAALRSDLFELADDSMAGRLVGSPELTQASDWIRGRFESLGLEPAGDNGTYDQLFDLVWFRLGEPNALQIGDARPRAPGEGWTPSSAGGSGTVSGEVVFAGFGLVEPRLDWDDYGGENVAGRVVLVLDREPGVDDPSSPFDGVVTTEASRGWRKALAAQERGAVAILFVRDVHNRDDLRDWMPYHSGQWPIEGRRIERFTLGAWAEGIDIPAAEISVEAAEALLASDDPPLMELAQAAESAEGGLGVIPLGGPEVGLTTAVDRNVTPGRNILGMIQGSEPELMNEVVIIGAHHDHNGMDSTVVFNGADDDGSGTVGVMAVAEAYATALESGVRPRRSVLFAIWDAEERGLLGAWYYTLRPIFPLQRTVANLNLDMIGRHEEVPTDGGGRFRGLEPQSAESNVNALNILGYSRAPELAAVVESANETTGLELRFRYDNNPSNLLRRSDHWPFLQNGVPAVWFHTGLHPDYHTPDDDPERIEYEKMTRVVRLVLQTSWDLANADSRPAFEPMGPTPGS